ncbi:hypothetical protein [Streptomyces clavuligerus]|uniref:hypothetical protein n=1 Tax=Streptomyces clavuligerus TaxID=1901 RepID=UPI001F0726C1|nr:hypothetical protein [Streptomyces clavuligerus]
MALRGRGGVVHGGTRVRREIAGLPREARIDRLVETGIILGGRAQMAKDHAGLVEAQGDLLREALDHLQPDDGALDTGRLHPGAEPS